jgi:hypothetical protein
MLENVGYLYYIRAIFHGDYKQCNDEKAAKERQGAEF